MVEAAGVMPSSNGSLLCLLIQICLALRLKAVLLFPSGLLKFEQQDREQNIPFPLLISASLAQNKPLQFKHIVSTFMASPSSI
jgi:hypothetical protein